MGLSALRNQDLKLVNVPRAVCALASRCAVSLCAQDSLPLAGSAQGSDGFPAGNLELNLHPGTVEIACVVAVMFFYVAECQAM